MCAIKAFTDEELAEIRDSVWFFATDPATGQDTTEVYVHTSGTVSIPFRFDNRKPTKRQRWAQIKETKMSDTQAETQRRLRIRKTTPDGNFEELLRVTRQAGYDDGLAVGKEMGRKEGHDYAPRLHGATTQTRPVFMNPIDNLPSADYAAVGGTMDAEAAVVRRTRFDVPADHVGMLYKYRFEIEYSPVVRRSHLLVIVDTVLFEPRASGAVESHSGTFTGAVEMSAELAASSIAEESAIRLLSLLANRVSAHVHMPTFVSSLVHFFAGNQSAFYRMFGERSYGFTMELAEKIREACYERVGYVEDQENR